jgi:hypothetical protein
MSDVLDGAPALVETPVATPEPVAPTQETTAAPEVTETPEATEKMLSQSEVDKIVQKRLAKESRRYEREANERAQLMARALAAERQLEVTQPRPQAAPDGKPNLSQFQDYESYTEALTDWKTNQAIEKRFADENERRWRLQEQQLNVKRAEALRPKIDEAISKYDDWAEVATTFAMPQMMEEAVLESPLVADVAYFLGQNPNEVDRIARLSPAAQVREIAKIETKLSAPVTPTNAPPPIKPSGTKASVRTDTFNLPWDEFVAKRRKEMARLK